MKVRLSFANAVGIVCNLWEIASSLALLASRNDNFTPPRLPLKGRNTFEFVVFVEKWYNLIKNIELRIKNHE